MTLAAIKDRGLRAHAQNRPRGVNGRVASTDDGHSGTQIHLFLAGDRLKKQQRRMNVLELGAWQIKPGFLPRSDGDEDGIEARGQIVQRQIEADAFVEHELHAHAFDEVEFAAQNRLGQPVLGNGEAQHAAGLAALLEDRHFMAEHREIERSGEPSGAGAGDSHLAAGRRKPALLNALRAWVRNDRIGRWSRR